MADIKQAFGASTAITITLNSLASSATAGRESTAVDNGTDKFSDALLSVSAKLAAGTPANDKAIYVYGYASEDGTNYTDPATGADAAVTTVRVPTNLVLIGVIMAPDSGALTYKGVFSVAKAFGGVLPRKWGVVIRNYTGVAFDTTGNSVTYSGVYHTSA
jgi:hypothetical protein